MSKSIQSTNFASSLINSEGSNMSMKYGGLIHSSLYKKSRIALISLFNYTYTISPEFTLLHTIMMMFRILQFMGPCLNDGSSVWQDNSVNKWVSGVISIFYHLIPEFARDDATFYLCVVYIVISFLFILILLISTYYFGHVSKLPKALPYFFSIYMATWNYLSHPIALNLCFEHISKIVFIKGYKYDLISSVIVASLIVILLCWNFWFYLLIASQTLTFRPTSLMTTMITPQNMMFVSVNLINIIMGFASNASKIVQIVLLVISAIICGFSAYIPYYNGGLISKNEGAAISSACSVGAVLNIFNIVVILGMLNDPLPLLFIMISLFLVLMVAFVMIQNAIASDHYILLDKIYDNDQNFQNIHSIAKFLNVSINGMKIAHPVCISFDIFKLGVDKWREEARCWFVFAKFSALYPEDTTTLSWVYHSILAAKIKGALARTIKEQTITITRQRESNLSPGLKLKLNAIQKSNSSTKHKLRRVWDLAIQGNINEIESSVKKFDSELEKDDAEFKHLFREYPNNRFVTRCYARFCKELKANHAEYMEYVEKSRQLQRGCSISEDLTHKFGIFAFPSLPLKRNVKVESQVLSGDINTMSSFDLSENEEDQSLVEETGVNNLREVIENLKIPAISFTKTSRIIILFLFFITPIVAFLIYTSFFITKLIEPLQHIKTMALVSQRNMFITVFNAQYFFEVLKIWPKTLEQAIPPSSFGGTYNTLLMLQHMIGLTTTATQDMYDFRAFPSTNEHIKNAQKQLFELSVDYIFYKNNTDKTNSKQTIQSSLMDMITQMSNMFSEPVIKKEFINKSYVLNPMYNSDQIDICFEVALSEMILYLSDTYESTKKLSQIICIVTIIFVIILHFFFLIFQVVWIQHNKEEAYRCLVALPKNAVSQLVENLRVLKSEDNDSGTNTDTEINKQEDNVMKLFVTGGDNSNSSLADRLMLIIGSILLAGLTIISIVLFSNLYIDESKQILLLSPHLNYLKATFGQSLAAQYFLHITTLLYENNEVSPTIFTVKELEEKFEGRIETFRKYYNLARFGGPSSDEAPYTGFTKAVSNANSYISCKSRTEMPKDFMEMVGCYNIEGVFTLQEAMLVTKYLRTKRSSYIIHSNDTTFEYLFTLTLSPIYEGLFGPMFNDIIPTIEDELQEKRNLDYTIIIVLLVFGILFEVFVMWQVIYVEKHIRSVLKLILHCHQQFVLSTPKVMTVLHGDFSRSMGDLTKRNAEFYDNVFTLLPDAILICEPMSDIVQTVSKAVTRILFANENELIGKSVKEILHEPRFSGVKDSLFKSNNQLEGIRVSEKDPEGSQVELEISTMKVNNQSVFIIRDVTSTVRYNTLIQDERKKSDALLASILPPMLVKRVQNGEKNISFSVQSVTILFLDIVSFTPWCGSNEAEKVMMTLNLLFKKLDACCNSYITMTKIKCIGDCYMAAGGVFQEVNNPTDHARDVVSFGLDALDAVRELNSELNESLQIRVGVNTGGPIVAGVLGIGKPTFEILGPAINMAQQMEHNGIPMKVHISRPVYELIYGESFKVKERGEIEVKNGTVVTYIVEERCAAIHN